jgi:glucose-6-phosphate dehydrogenase assembly protein OpcA
VTSGDKRDLFERGESIEVPLGKIESELSSLWRQAAEPVPGEKPRAISRACLWTLLLRVEGEQMFVAAKRLVDDISVHVPARVIVMHVEPERDDAPIRSWVEANWRKSGHGDSGSDEVTLWASGEAVDRLPPLVRSLLVTDVPVAMLWWGKPPGKHAAARELLADIDRLIVDSRQLTSEAQFADYEQLSIARPDLELVDCAWLGVRPMRGLFAGLFDPPHDPTRLEMLDRVRVISGVIGCQSRALLTIGWLGSRLGWNEIKTDKDAPNLRRWKARRRNGGEVTIELETRNGAIHGVAGLELVAGKDEWTVKRENQCIQVKGPNRPDRVQPVRQHTDAELVVSALGPRGRDPVFRSALSEAVKLVGSK